MWVLLCSFYLSGVDGVFSVWCGDLFSRIPLMLFDIHVT